MKSFAEFYPFYLSEHAKPGTRRCHFAGTLGVIGLLAWSIASASWQLLWWLPVVGYGPAWAGHLLIEKNRPATFRHPLYSLLGDFVMFKDMLTGKVSF